MVRKGEGYNPKLSLGWDGTETVSGTVVRMKWNGTHYGPIPKVSLEWDGTENGTDLLLRSR